jgi:hypothetical protein
MRGGTDEFDLRLPYKRFKELYPRSNITYEEYKKPQAQRAFKKARNSNSNNRMVKWANPKLNYLKDNS